MKLQFLFFVIILFCTFAKAQFQEDKLLPEIKQITVLPEFNNAWLNNNLATDIAGILSLNPNYSNVGALVIKNGYQTLFNQFSATPEYSYNESIYRNFYPQKNQSLNYIGIISANDTALYRSPFTDYKGWKMIETLKESRDTITLDRSSHRMLLGRYQQLPLEKTYREIRFNSQLGNKPIVLPQLSPQNIFGLSTSQIFQGMLHIIDGKTTQGLDLIAREYVLMQIFIRGEHHTLRNSHYYWQLADFIYFTIEQLIDFELITGQDLQHPLFTMIEEPLLTRTELKASLAALLQRNFSENIRQAYLELPEYQYAALPWKEGIYVDIGGDEKRTEFLNLLYHYYDNHYQNFLLDSEITEPLMDFEQARQAWENHNHFREYSIELTNSYQSEYLNRLDPLLLFPHAVLDLQIELTTKLQKR